MLQGETRITVCQLMSRVTLIIKVVWFEVAYYTKAYVTPNDFPTDFGHTIGHKISHKIGPVISGNQTKVNNLGVTQPSYQGL